MKQVNLLLMSAAMTLAACGGTKDAGQAGVPLIERSDIQIEGKRMTPEALWAMGRTTVYRRTRVTVKSS